MTTNAYTGAQTLKRGDGNSPEVFTEIEEVTGISGVGVTNERIEVTHFGSGGVREFIAGLADGSEINVTCNEVLSATSIQEDLMTDVDNKSTVNFELIKTDGTTTQTVTFAATVDSYEPAPSRDAQNELGFTLKITGSVTRAYS